MFVRLCVISLLICIAAAAFENFPESEWRQADRATGAESVTFTLALKLENLEALNELTVRLTTPGSPEYRQWKTIEELNEITRPNPMKVHRLKLWLKEHSLVAEDFVDFIKVTGRVADVDAAFETEYYQYQSRIYHGQSILRSSKHPLIPHQFRDLVMFITGASNFPFPTEARQARAPKVAPGGVGSYYTVPQTLRAQYGVPASYVASNPRSSQGLVEFGFAAGISIPDLQQFMSLTGGNTNANLSYTVGNFHFYPIDPVNTESTLDVQYIMGVAPGVPTSFFVVDGWIYDFTALIQQRASQNLPNPLIFSISYGYNEADQCEITKSGTGCGQLGGTSASYVTNTNAGFQKLGLLGYTVFVASGDSGAASSTNNNCRDKTTPIQPDYPASSDFVTTVGGTMFQSASVLSGSVPPFCTQNGITCAGSGQEVVSALPESLITSGGGFSNVAATPTWQQSAVTNYLNSGALLPPSNLYNSSCRGYPDLAALAHHFMIVYNGRSTAVDGTSAAAPLTAGIFALVQDNILNSGGAPLGFMNPTLYSKYVATPSITLDITYGNNTTTEGSSVVGTPCTTPGYGATAGWDAATGLGSPYYPSLVSALN